MDLIRVASEQSKPDIVVFRNGPAEAAAINITHRKIFIKSTFPSWFDSHCEFLLTTDLMGTVPYSVTGDERRRFLLITLPFALFTLPFALCPSSPPCP
jgi:hypothetical protein